MHLDAGSIMPDYVMHFFPPLSCCDVISDKRKKLMVTKLFVVCKRFLVKIEADVKNVETEQKEFLVKHVFNAL